jgi:hypothetical protein
MKKIIIYLLAPVAIGLAFAGCSINKQVQQIKALENCVYEIASADSIYLAHTNVTKLVNDGQFDLNKMPGIAIAVLRQNIPLEARLNLRIKNPSNELAAINQFEYKVLIKDQEIANGFVNRKVEVPALGGVTMVPVMLNSNIYSFLSNGKTLNDISDFITGGKTGNAEKKSMITIKFKPTIQSGNKLVAYPGWITINKEVSSKILF